MSPNSWGLALAAGGARGAYQAGALLALAETGLRCDAVAGTSIGALNSAFYAQGDGSAGHLEKLCALWRALPEAGIIQMDLRAFTLALTSILVKELRFVLPAQSKLGLSFLDPRPMAAFLDQWLEYRHIGSSGCDLWITVLPSVEPLIDVVSAPWRKSVYLRASDLTPADLRAAILASAAIPFAFPAQRIQGHSYSDAGLSDALPASLLYRQNYRRIVSVFLSDFTVQHREDFPGARILQLRPSSNIDTGFFSTFDFSQPAIERLLEMGHKDAKGNLAEIVDLWSRMARLRASGRENERLADSLPTRPGVDLEPEPKDRNS